MKEINFYTQISPKHLNFARKKPLECVHSGHINHLTTMPWILQSVSHILHVYDLWQIAHTLPSFVKHTEPILLFFQSPVNGKTFIIKSMHTLVHVHDAAEKWAIIKQ
jgi:hypothetical protein